jgi:hypothetical protein
MLVGGVGCDHPHQRDLLFSPLQWGVGSPLPPYWAGGLKVIVAVMYGGGCGVWYIPCGG